MSNQAELRDALFIPSDSRANFKQIIAKRSDLVRFDGGRTYNAGPGLYVTIEAGTVMGFASTGGDAGHYKPYASTNTDGSEVAVGVLSEQVVVDDAYNGSECVIIKSGVLFKDALIGLDAGAITNLKAISSVEHGTNLLSF